MANPIQANPIQARPIQANSIGSVKMSGPLILDTVVGSIIKEAATRRIDILAIGDSNQAFSNSGFDTGNQYALNQKFALYSSGVLTARENNGSGQGLGYTCSGGDRDVTASSIGAPTVLHNFMDGNIFPQQYAYIGVDSFVQGYGLFMFLDLAEDPFDILNSDVRFHFCQGSFDTGSGTFVNGIRLEVTPFTNYVNSAVLSTNLGTEGLYYTFFDSGVSDVPRIGQITGRLVHAGRTANSPWIGYFTRAEIVSRKEGISYTTMYSNGSSSLYTMASSFIAANDNTIYLQLFEARRLQESEGLIPKVVIYVNSGLNDRNETTSPSLGPGAFPDPTSADSFIDNFIALKNRVEFVWNANFGDGTIAWMLIPSHPVSTPDDVLLISYRDASLVYAGTQPNVDTVNIEKIVDSDTMLANGWYASLGADKNHLTKEGYYGLSLAIL